MTDTVALAIVAAIQTVALAWIGAKYHTARTIIKKLNNGAKNEPKEPIS